MAGERSVRIDFEAREELSRAVQKIDKSLDQLKSSLGTTAGALEGVDASSQRAQDELDEVGDEANQATASLSALIGASAGLQAAFAGMDDDIDIDIDPDSVEDGAVSFRRLKEQILDFDDVGDLDRNHVLRRISRRRGMPVTRVAKEFKDANARLRGIGKEGRTRGVKVPVELEEAAEVELSEEASQAARSAQAEAVDVSLNVPEGQTQHAMMEVGKATKKIEESSASNVDLNLKVPEGQKAHALMEVGKATSAIEASTANNVDIEFDVADEVLELFALASSLSAVQAQAIAASASTRAAASGIDEMGDESIESAAEMGVLASVASVMSLNTTALSLNVGAFNIALANLATQIPILISLLGTLLTVLMGVAGAAILATTAFAGLVAGGFIAELTRISEEFENIENRMEAMQAIMQSMVPAFIKAFEPLIEAGENANSFFGVMNSILKTVNVFSKGIADSMEFSRRQMQEFIAVGESMGLISDSMSRAEIDDQIMSLGEFFGELSRIWKENVQDIIRGTQVMSAFLLPVLADIIEFFITGFDDMVLFVTKFTNELAVIGPALSDLITFATELIELGSRLLQGLLPVFVGLLNIGTEIASMFNALSPQVVRTVAGIAALTFVTSKLITLYGRLASAMATIFAGTAVQTIATGALANARAVMIGELTIMTGLERTLALIRSRLIAATWGKVAATWASVTATGAASGATLSLAGAYATLSAVTGGLLTLLPAIATALIAIVGAGAVTVGVLGNMGSVTSGLGATLSIIKSIIVAIANILLTVFITTWNVLAIAIEANIKMWQHFFDVLTNIIPFTDIIAAKVQMLVDGFWSLVDVLTNIPSIVSGTFDAIAGAIEDFINMMPDWLKGVFGIEGDFQFQSPGEGLTVSREDIVSGSGDSTSAMGEMEGTRANQFNYNEENINEVAQEINADPEDKESLKRIVKDAMEEANSFTRRQQGGN